MNKLAKVTTNFKPEQVVKQANFAMAKTLTELAQRAKAQTLKEMQARFDRPTPYTMQSLFVQGARKDALVSKVGLKDRFQAKSVGPAAETIRQQFVGGERRFKRSEGAFLRMGMLREGQVIVPGPDAPLDQYGNIKRSFMIRIMSYLQAFGEQGYKANATDLSRKRMAKYTKQSGYKEIGGVVYFYSPGKGFYNGKRNHLAAGIWSKRGVHGVDVRPVLLFVKKPFYQKIVDMEGITSRVHLQDMQAVFDQHFGLAMATAR